VNLFQFQVWLSFGLPMRLISWNQEQSLPLADRCLGRWLEYRGHVGD
jgi:hypothetical protein